MREALQRYRSVIADSARWEGFEFRGGDIVISTPPKCGTTWMQMLCALLVFQGPGLPGLLTELSPWLDAQTEPVHDVFARLGAQKHRRFIKTHTPLDGVPNDERVTYICVGRDPRDAAISWDNNMRNTNLGAMITARAAAVGLHDLRELLPDWPEPPAQDPLDRFWRWVEDDAPPQESLSSLKAAIHHFNTFWERRDRSNVVLFHFADLRADLEAEMRRLAETLQIETDEARWPSLVSAATFEHMRGRADELAPQVTIDGFWNDTSRFFNRGSTGQWRSFIAAGQLARYEARVRDLATPGVAAWVHTGWRAQSI